MYVTLTLTGPGIGITCVQQEIHLNPILLAIEQYCPAPCWMLISAHRASSKAAGAYSMLKFRPEKARPG